MWLITENGVARNLSQAYKIEIGDYRGVSKVYATFPICINKNSADPAFAESAVIKTFDNVDDAKKCIAEIVHALNGDEKVGYSFSWLKNEPPAETEKPVDNKPSLIDGIAL